MSMSKYPTKGKFCRKLREVTAVRVRRDNEEQLQQLVLGGRLIEMDPPPSGAGSVIIDGGLYKGLDALNIATAELKQYKFPHNVISAARLGKIAKSGMCLEFERDSIYRVSKLADGTAIYGCGFLISEKAAAEKAAAVTLSEAEWEIIKALE